MDQLKSRRGRLSLAATIEAAGRTSERAPRETSEMRTSTVASDNHPGAFARVDCGRRPLHVVVHRVRSGRCSLIACVCSRTCLCARLVASGRRESARHGASDRISTERLPKWLTWPGRRRAGGTPAFGTLQIFRPSIGGTHGWPRRECGGWMIQLTGLTGRDRRRRDRAATSPPGAGRGDSALAAAGQRSRRRRHNDRVRVVRVARSRVTGAVGWRSLLVKAWRRSCRLTGASDGAAAVARSAPAPIRNAFVAIVTELLGGSKGLPRDRRRRRSVDGALGGNWDFRHYRGRSRQPARVVRAVGGGASSRTTRTRWDYHC